MKTALHTEWTVGDVCKTNNRASGTNEKAIIWGLPAGSRSFKEKNDIKKGVCAHTHSCLYNNE